MSVPIGLITAALSDAQNSANAETENAESSGGGGLLSNIGGGGGFLSGLFQPPDIPEIVDVGGTETNYTPLYILSAVFIAAIIAAFTLSK